MLDDSYVYVKVFTLLYNFYCYDTRVFGCGRKFYDVDVHVSHCRVLYPVDVYVNVYMHLD